jgi:hypothetical protein
MARTVPGIKRLEHQPNQRGLAMNALRIASIFFAVSFGLGALALAGFETFPDHGFFMVMFGLASLSAVVIANTLNR